MPRSVTCAEALADGAAVLRAAGVANARQDARLLLCYVLGCGIETIVGRSEQPVAADRRDRYRALVARRADREPLAYITGRREFWSLDLAVGPGVLDPRPDSETVVEAALASIADRQRPLRLLDIGTGSGCLLLALLAELPEAHGVGVDAGRAAVAVARANAGRTGLDGRACFVRGDWTAALDGRFDLIVSNPPYIRSADLAGLAPEVARHEPRDALDGGQDGLDAYRSLAPELRRLLTADGHAVLEVGFDQAKAVAGILVSGGMRVTAVHRDLAGVDRCVVASLA